jgi:hypothetical protein
MFLKTLNNHILKLPTIQQMIKLSLTSSVKAIVMDRPTITFGNNGSLKPGDKGNFFIKGKITDHEKAKLTNWVIIYERDEQFAESVETELYEAGKRIGVDLDFSKKIKMPDGKREAIHIKNAVDAAAKHKP